MGTLGTATLFLDYDAGCAHLAHALELALADGLHGLAANTHSNLGSGSGEVWRLREARPHLKAAIAFSQQHEIDFYRHYSVAWLALCELHLGQWDDAREHALRHRRAGHPAHTSRVMALAALGRLQARRGEPEAAADAGRGPRAGPASGTLQRIAPVRCARAEAAWLRGDLPGTTPRAGAALALAEAQRHAWFAGELAQWVRRAGAAAGARRVRAAARAAAGRPPVAGPPTRGPRWAPVRAGARAGRGRRGGARLAALAVFDDWGPAAAERLRKTLRAAGVRGIPPAPVQRRRPTRTSSPSARREVLELLCAGLKNSEIAERLCRSVRTVDHHVAATFAKLGVGTRAEAARPRGGRASPRKMGSRGAQSGQDRRRAEGAPP